MDSTTQLDHMEIMTTENQITAEREETETTAQVSATLPESLYKLVEAEAIAEDRTVSAQIRRIVASHYRNAKPARV
jgi:hypothetical protein